MRKLGVLMIVAVLGTASTAAAGGYDIPILYSARHIGAGGTAVADVDDSSAIFHNPSGIGQIGKGNLLLNVSLLTGDLQSTPSLLGNPPPNVVSEPVVAPFFIVGGSGRVHEYVTLGLAAYPVAAASGEYRYPLQLGQLAQDVTDKTSLIFMEASPAIAVNIDKIGLRIGLGYRLTFVSLERYRNSAPTDVAVHMTGFNFLGFRVGFQWRFTDYITIGMNYRTKTKTKIDQTRDAGTTGGSPSGLGSDFASAETEITLPARLSGGMRFDWAPFALMVDFEWGFNSQNDRIAIQTVDAADGTPGSIPNVFEWQDQWTLRTGTEYRVYKEKIPLRLGFIYDSKTTNILYPSGFSTPPTHTYSVTVGLGYDHGPWQLNFAYARRYGKTFIDDPENPQTATTADDTLPRNDLLAECPACGFAGDYRFRINGFYVDFSWDWY